MFAKISNTLERWRTRRDMARKGLLSVRGRRREDSEFVLAIEQSRVLGIFLALLLWGVITLMLVIPAHTESRFHLQVGELAPYSVVSELDFEYEDQAATQLTLAKAESQIPLSYRVDKERNTVISANFQQFFEALQARLTGRNLDLEQSKTAGAQLAQSLDEQVLAALNRFLTSTEAQKAFFEALSLPLQKGFIDDTFRNKNRTRLIKTTDILGRGFTQQMTVISSVWGVVDRLNGVVMAQVDSSTGVESISEYLRNSFFELLGKGNLVEDGGNQAELARIRAEIKPVMVEVFAKQSIVERGKLVTPDVVQKLSAYEKQLAQSEHASGNYIRLFQNLLWSLVLVLFVGIYLYHLNPDVINSNKYLALVGVVIILTLLINYFAIRLFYYVSSTFEQMSPNLVINAVPITLGSILLAAMLGFRVALFGGLLVSAVMAMMLGQSFSFAFEGMLGCAVCALFLRRVSSYRTFFLRTLLVVSLTSWLLDFNLNRYVTDWQLLLPAGVIGICNGVFTAVMAQSLIFLFELIFKINTQMSLMMLCDYSHPLLERLKREASGTFFHSLMVSTLAEDAARAIGANALVAKVGALFHDIGKLSKPQYFTENNLEEENQHLDLNPQVSSIIIRDHVKEGLELARQYHLQRVIRDAIEQHHGNDLVHYFFQRAMESHRQGGTPIVEAQFRYQGIPPQSKEMAIISLADACEAAARALDKPTASKIESLVDEIFRKRFRDGQLVQARLTLEELEKVRDSFVNNLVSMRHGRVSYNKEENSDEGDLFVAGQNAAGTDQQKTAPQAY